MAVKKKASPFWRVYLIITVLLFAALGAWLIYLYSWLSDYEASQPKYVAEDTFNEYFADFDPRAYASKCYTSSGMIDTEEDVAAYLKNVTDGKEITYKKVSSGMESGYKYVVLAGEDEVKFASFMIVEDESAGGKFKCYKADNFELYTSASVKITLEVPKGYKVIFNGTTLSEDYIKENDIPTDSCDHMPEGVSGLYYSKYVLSALASTPVIEVQSPDGSVATLESKGNSYKAIPVYDTTLSEEYSEWILEGIEKYAKYSQYDSEVNTTGFNQVAPYFDPDSELYVSIKTMENMFVIHYDKYEFSDMSASEFVKYDENTFSCRVQYTQKLYKGKEVYDDFVDQTLYLRRVDDKFLIYDMNVN